MFAGIMMTAINKTLSGRLGLPGWRWVFIIDGLITLPIAVSPSQPKQDLPDIQVWGFMTFPDSPYDTKARYLSQDERDMAIARLPARRIQRDLSFMSLMKRVGRSKYL
jgi:ACS family pantothenate transporter-like MFS transporter